MVDPKLLLASGTKLAALVRAGKTTARELVDLHIAWLETMNPRLNAVVASRFQAARAEADAADRHISERGTERLPAFFGVPCTIKESFALEGMPNTAGLVARRGFTASSDAEAVRRLRLAGAIPLGVTNVSELCMWLESNNRVYGRSNNPYDTGRIVGGSSGGEGASVAAAMAPFGLGSDIGGSIRLPAFFNGVFGLKPSAGRVPNEGQFPIAENGALRYLCTGPLARRAEDLMPLLGVLAAPSADPDLPALGDPSHVDLRRLTILDVPGNDENEIDERLYLAQTRVAEHLGAVGAKVVRKRIRELAASMWIWASGMSLAADTAFRTHLGNGRPARLWTELGRWLLRRSAHTLPALILAAIEDSPVLSEAEMRSTLAWGLELRDAIEEELGDHGVMLFPSYTDPAPRHYTPMLRPTSWAYTAVVNVFEMPAVQVPLGLTEEGTPLGVQVVAKRGREHVAIAVALELERAFGGWTPPLALRQWIESHG